MKFSIRKKNTIPANSSQSSVEPLINQQAKWLAADGEHANIVISTRIRLARNFSNTPFPNCATHNELMDILKQAEQLFSQLTVMNNGYFLTNTALSEMDKHLLLERHLISPIWLKQRLPAAVAISADEIISFMINEEDHLRIQVLQSGLQINQAWEICRHLDDEIGKIFDLAFSDYFGYLTACPTNAGTGMRISVAINLVALALKKEIDTIVKEKFADEFTIRGFYGEGTDVWGYIFQVSNQLTLGRSEEGILRRFSDFVNKLVEAEQTARKSLYEHNRVVLEDKVFRARAILKNARILSTVESINLISYLRLGADLGLIDDISHQELNGLMVLLQPAHLQKFHGGELASEKRDVLRPQFIQKKLKL